MKVKWLLISDTHANLEALEAVLDAADYDRLAFLGDAVDYGPDPELVVDRLRAAQRDGAVLVRGNHDEAVATPAEDFDPTWWSELASSTMRYSRSRLQRDQLNFLAGLPLTAEVDLGAGGRALLCHGAPASNREYLWPDLAEAALRASVAGHTRDLARLFVGHTHLQFERRLGALTIGNPGSVGQPRDGDPRAGFAIFDTAEGRLALHRLKYPVEKTVAKIRARGMPHAGRLAAILSTGGA